jgi:PAS domain S-box-containing protein
MPHTKLGRSKRTSAVISPQWEGHLASVIEHIPDAFIAFDTGWRYMYVNSKAELMVQKTKEELVGKVVYDIFPDIKQNPVFQVAITAMETRTPQRTEYLSPSTGRWLQANFYPTDFGIAAYYNDVTSVKTQEEQYRRLLDHSPVPIAIHAKGVLIYVNQLSVQLMHAHSAEELIGKNVWNFVHPDYTAVVKQRISQIYTGQEYTNTLEEKFICVDGDIIDVEVSSLLVTFEGSPAIQIVVRDITEEKRTAERLRMHTQILDSMTEGVSVSNPKGIIIYTNPAEDRMFGYQPGELIGKNILVKHRRSTEDKTTLMQEVQAQLNEKGEWHGQLHNSKKDGTLFITNSHITTVQIEGKPHWVCVQDDITEQQEIEDELKSAEERYRLVVENTNDLISIIDHKGMFQYISPAYLRVLGYTPEELLDTSAFDLIHPDDMKGTKKEFKRSISTSFGSISLRFRHKNGEYLYFEGSANWTEDEDIEDRLAICIFRDTTERVKLDRQKDEFIGITSHELKTPVTSMKIFAQVLQKKFVKAGDLKSASLLEKMDLQLDKLTSLITDLLDVTRIETGKFSFENEVFDLNTLISEIVEEMQRTTTHKIKKKLAKTHLLYADRNRIEQVIINFLSNAIKYSPQADTVVISTFTDQGHVSVCVEDFGIGISPEHQSRIFSRFFRVSGSKENTYPGIGLGLYISSEIIRRQGGKIWIESEEGKGSRFYFRLPVHTQ